MTLSKGGSSLPAAVKIKHVAKCNGRGGAILVGVGTM